MRSEFPRRALRACIHIVSAASGMLASSQLWAQAKVPAAPDYLPNRYDEKWAGPDVTAGSLGQLKHITIGGRKDWWVTLSASARFRSEHDASFMFSGASSADDAFMVRRVLVGADARLGQYVRAYVEGRDAHADGRTLAGGTRVTDAERPDLVYAFADLGNAKARVRAGRQGLSLGRERLVGSADWNNNRRSYQGVRGMATWRGINFEAFDGGVVSLDIKRANVMDSTVHFRMAAVGVADGAAPKQAWRPAGWQAYTMEQAYRKTSSGSRRTTGARALWKVRRPSLDWSFEAEGATQSGTVAAKTLDAWFYATELKAQARAVRWKPAVIVGEDEASGNASGSTPFVMPYPTAHAHGGIADALGRANLREWRGGVTVDPRAGWQVALTQRAFTRRSLADGVYNKGGGVLRAAGGSPLSTVADETDLVVTGRWTRHVRVNAGWAVAQPKAFLKNTTGGASTYQFGYFELSFLF